MARTTSEQAWPDSLRSWPSPSSTSTSNANQPSNAASTEPHFARFITDNEDSATCARADDSQRRRSGSRHCRNSTATPSRRHAVRRAVSLCSSLVGLGGFDSQTPLHTLLRSARSLQRSGPTQGGSHQFSFHKQERPLTGPFLFVDLTGGLSKLAPPAIQMMRAHRSIRARRHRRHRRRHQAQQAPRASEDVLQRAEAAYTAGGSLKAVARQVGLGHERLSRLLRERGVVLRNHSPSTSTIRLMCAMYEQGASLERVGDRFGYTAGTVRTHLIAAGVMMRDTHSRGALPKAHQAHR